MQQLSAPSTRPAYMDQFFRDAPIPPSAHSSTSSISTTSSGSTYNPRNTTYSGRSLSPPPEEGSDTSSIRSSKTGEKKWYNLGTILHRRTYPQSEEADRPSIKAEDSKSSSPVDGPTSRRPSLPKVLTTFPPPQAINTYARRPLPAVPQPASLQKRPSLMHKASAPLPTSTVPERKSSKRRPSAEKAQPRVSKQELSCQRCYYFTARNCNGYVLGGESGDACEGCLVRHFPPSRLTKSQLTIHLAIWLLWSKIIMTFP